MVVCHCTNSILSLHIFNLSLHILCVTAHYFMPWHQPSVGEGLPLPPSGNLGIFVGGDLSVCTANVRVQSSSVAFTVQIHQRCKLTGLSTKHPWMVVYFSSPQQQQRQHTHFISFHARYRHCCIHYYQ